MRQEQFKVLARTISTPVLCTMYERILTLIPDVHPDSPEGQKIIADPTALRYIQGLMIVCDVLEDEIMRRGIEGNAQCLRLADTIIEAKIRAESIDPNDF